MLLLALTLSLVILAANKGLPTHVHTPRRTLRCLLARSEIVLILLLLCAAVASGSSRTASESYFLFSPTSTRRERIAGESLSTSAGALKAPLNSVLA